MKRLDCSGSSDLCSVFLAIGDHIWKRLRNSRNALKLCTRRTTAFDLPKAGMQVVYPAALLFNLPSLIVTILLKKLQFLLVRHLIPSWKPRHNLLPDLVGTYQDSSSGGRRHFLPPRFIGNSSWYGALGLRFAISCLIRKALSSKALERDIGTLFVIDAKLDAGVLPEIELGKIPVKMLNIDVLVNADKAALQNRKEAFQRVGMRLAARPFELGMIDHFVLGDRRKLVARSGIGHQRAFVVDVLANDAHGAAVVQHGRTDIATTFHKAHDDGIVQLAAEANRTLGLARPRQLGFVSFNDLPRAAQRARGRQRSHRVADTVAKVPSRFHAALKRPLKLAGRNAFLGRAKQVDGLKPEPQRQMAVLENRTDPHRERLAAGVAFAQAGTGRLALKPPNLGGICVRTMGTDRAVRPKLRFNIVESGLLVVKPISGKNRFGHGLAPNGQTLHYGDGYVK